MPVGADVQDLPRPAAGNMGGGKTALIVDEILGVISGLEEGFRKDLKPPGIFLQGFPVSLELFLRVQPRLPENSTQERKNKIFTAESAGDAEMKTHTHDLFPEYISCFRVWLCVLCELCG
jgi:hypothetical protein